MFCFFTPAPFISARTIRPGFDTSISVQYSARSAPFFPLLSSTQPPPIARWNKLLAHLQTSPDEKSWGRKIWVIPRRHSAPEVIALFVPLPSAQWPGIIRSEMRYVWHDGWRGSRYVRRSNARNVRDARSTESLSGDSLFRGFYEKNHWQWRLLRQPSTLSGEYTRDTPSRQRKGL